MRKINFFLLFIVLLLSTNFVHAEMRNSISQYGITWTFNGSYECGQFVTGDWWVVGPVVINSVSPGQTAGRNGSVVNPMPFVQGYDNRSYPGNIYNASVRASFPLTMQPNQSLVSSISKPGTVDFKNVGTLNAQAVLTVVSSSQSSGTFRPGYAGTYKRYFNASQISGLPSVAAPASKPSGSALASYTDRPRIDHYGSWVIQFGCAENNWINGVGIHKCYGQQYSEMMSQAALYAMLDVPDRMQIVYNLIQMGIDNYSVLKAGGRWGADGGHHSGRVFPIVLAAKLLNDPDMLSVGNNYAGNFGENNQTYIGNNSKPLWGKPGPATYFLNGCSGSGGKDDRDPAHNVDGCPDYRDHQTSRTWPGQALAALMFDGKAAWGHDAYFAYVDRWMSGGVASPGAGSGGSTFVNDMWAMYRGVVPIVSGVSSPQFSPAPGNYTSAQSVSITTSTSGATIRYTTNGTNPSETSGTVYTGAISLSSQTTLKAIAYKSGMTSSPVITALYTFDLQAPSVPQNLTVTGTGLASVSLSWSASTDNVGVTGYNVYVNGANPQSVTGTTATINGLNPATSYTFTVSAYDAAGLESAQSSSVVGTTENATLVSVTSATASSYEAGTTNTPDKAIDGNLVTRWSASGDGQWLQLQLSGSANITALGISFYNGNTRSSYFDVQVSSNGASWTTIESNLESSGTTTDIEIFDISNTNASYIRYVGHGNSSNTWNSVQEIEVYAAGVVEPDTEAPSIPGTPSASNITENSVDLSWTASTDNQSGVAGYKVYTNGANPQTVTGTSTTISGLTAQTTYSFTVSAFDGASNESDQSSATQVTTAAAPTTITVDETIQAEDYSSVSSCNVATNNAGYTGAGFLDYGGNGTWGEWSYTSPGDGTITLSLRYANGSGGNRQCALTVNGSSEGNIAFAATSGWTDWVTATVDIDVIEGTNTIRLTANTSSGGPNLDKLDLDGDVNVDGGDTEAPSIPTGLASGAVTTSSVALNWNASTDNVGVTGYKVYTNGANPQTVGGTSATISGLSENTQYSFTVSAFDAAGNESNQSSALQVTTDQFVDTDAPSVPTGLAAGTVTTTTVALSWSASTDNVGVTGYKVYTNGSNPQTVGGTSTTISGLTAETQYSFTVSAYDAAGNESNQSSALQVATDNLPDTDAPSVPTGLAAGTVTTTTVALSWNASTDNVGVTGYKVYTGGSNPQTVAGTSTTINGLADGATYNFTVSAFDAAGNESAQSSALQVTTDEITGVTSSSTWQSFQVSTQTGTFTATFDAVPHGSNIDALTGIQNGTASAYGDMACIIRFNTSGNIDARNGGSYTATNTISYSAETSYAFRVEVNVPSHTYSVYVTPQGGSEQTVASNFAFRSEQASVSQLTGWTVYGYQGTHTVDNMVFDDGSTPDIQAPSIPGTPVASNITSNSVDLSWSASTDNEGVTGYKVYTNGSNPVTVGGTSTTISGLAAETQYSFTVSAFDAASNESSQSSAEVVTTDEEPSAPNLISNGEFDNGTTDWIAGNYGGTASLSAVTGQGMSGTNAMQISISSAGSNPWEIQISQDISIESGKTYEISFMAKAAANRTMDAVIQDFDAPYTEYWKENISLTTSAQTFGPYTFNCGITDATTRFKFFVAGNSSTIYVDNIVVSDVTSSSAQVELANEPASFKIYPNPVNGNVLNIALNKYDSDVANVTIYNLMGRIVYKNVYNVANQAELIIPVGDLNSGMYLISIQGSNNVVKQQTFVVNN